MARQYESAPELTIDLDRSYQAQITTNLGQITIEFDPARAPLAVNNFVHLARDGFYDDVIFHRVVPGFVIQGGDPTGTGRGGPGYKFRDELEGEGRYTRGTVAMANAGPNTNGSQFFICLNDVDLPHSYTIFGRVTEGMETVDAVAALPRSGEKPTQDAVIQSVEIREE
ncbi:MAG: peptidylprolyl isomerase [Actinomycetota bacterium]